MIMNPCQGEAGIDRSEAKYSSRVPALPIEHKHSLGQKRVPVSVQKAQIYGGDGRGLMMDMAVWTLVLEVFPAFVILILLRSFHIPLRETGSPGLLISADPLASLVSFQYKREKCNSWYLLYFSICSSGIRSVLLLSHFPV